MQILKIFNEEGASEKEIDSLRKRQATRGLVFDDSGRVCLLRSNKYGWYEFPGGGVEGGEEIEEAFLRECREESGCNVEIVSEIGKTIEVRLGHDLVNETCCYVARVVGEKGVPDLAEDEEEIGLEPLWVDVGEAESLIDNMAESPKLYRRYLKYRAQVILEKGLEKYNRA